MQFNSKKAKVLYIGVREETGLLQKMADAISAYFVAKGCKFLLMGWKFLPNGWICFINGFFFFFQITGLSTQDHERVTLHMTVVNKKFQKIENLNGYYRYSFDAGFMLKVF